MDYCVESVNNEGTPFVFLSIEILNVYPFIHISNSIYSSADNFVNINIGIELFISYKAA